MIRDALFFADLSADFLTVGCPCVTHSITTHLEDAEAFLEHHALDLHDYLLDPTVVGLSVDLNDDIRGAMQVLQRFMVS